MQFSVSIWTSGAERSRARSGEVMEEERSKKKELNKLMILRPSVLIEERREEKRDK